MLSYRNILKYPAEQNGHLELSHRIRASIFPKVVKRNQMKRIKIKELFPNRYFGSRHFFSVLGQIFNDIFHFFSICVISKVINDISKLFQLSSKSGLERGREREREKKRKKLLMTTPCETFFLPRQIILKN